MIKSAEISPCGKYRYLLTRSWRGFEALEEGENRGERVMTFIMLNPSVADANVDDATIRRCIHYGKREDFDSLRVINLFAFRTTWPQELWEAEDRQGENLEWIRKVALLVEDEWEQGRSMVVAAWGSNVSKKPEAERLIDTVADLFTDMWCLGRTAGGHPCHPCRLPNDRQLKPYASDGKVLQ